jgi:hypothetical protein
VPARAESPKREAVLEKNDALIELHTNELQHGFQASICRYRRPAGDVIAVHAAKQVAVAAW